MPPARVRKRTRASVWPRLGSNTSGRRPSISAAGRCARAGAVVPTLLVLDGAGPPFEASGSTNQLANSTKISTAVRVTFLDTDHLQWHVDQIYLIVRLETLHGA